MKSLLLVLSLLLADLKQEPNSWKLLSKVEIERRYDETFNFEVEFPIFSDEVKALDGKPITMEGWMIPLDELRGKNYFVLSALPFEFYLHRRKESFIFTLAKAVWRYACNIRLNFRGQIPL